MTFPDPRRRSRTLAYLVALQFFYAWAWNSSDVLRPAFRAALGLSLTQVGAGYSAQVVGALAGALALVRFEHVIGRRHTLALVSAGIGLSLVAGVLVGSWPAFLLQRFAIGFFGGAVFPLTIGLITELFDSRFRGRLASLVDGTYFGAVVVLGLAAGQTGMGGWQTLLWIGGVPPLLFAVAAYRFVPDYHAAPVTDAPRAARAGLFSAAHRTRTIMLTAMLGANACGSQAFSGWMTTYLHDVVHLPATQIGAIVAAQFGGAVAGCIGWGMVIDRFGRRAGALGVLTASVAVTLFLVAGPSPLLLGALAALFGVAFSAVVSIGPWLAELYPRELRTAATAMFQWGRFISLLAPLATGGLAGFYGLRAAMALAIVAFALAALLWSRLPETLVRE